MRYHFTPTRTAKMERLIITSVIEDMEKLEPSYMADDVVTLAAFKMLNIYSHHVSQKCHLMGV